MADKEQTPLVIIRRKQVEARTGLSRSSIYAAIKAGKFPAGISLSEKSVGWLQHEVDDWIASRVASSREGSSAVGSQSARPKNSMQQVAA